MATPHRADAAPASCTHRLQSDLFLTFMDGVAEGSIKVAGTHGFSSAESVPVSPAYAGSPTSGARMRMGSTGGYASLKSLGSPTARDSPRQESCSPRELVVNRVVSFIPDNTSLIKNKIARLPLGVRSLSGKISRSFWSVRHDNGVASHDLAI